MGLGLARIRLYESAESGGFGAWGRVKPRVRGVLGWFGWWLRSGLLALWIYPMAPLGKLGRLDPHLYGHDALFAMHILVLSEREADTVTYY